MLRFLEVCEGVGVPPRVKRLGASPSVKAWQPEISSEEKKSCLLLPFQIYYIKTHYLQSGSRGGERGEGEIDGGREGD